MTPDDRQPEATNPTTTSDSAPSPDKPPRLIVKSPADLIAAVPYMLGFHPEESLVIVGTDGPHGTAAMRVDLPCAGDVAAAQEVSTRMSDVLTRNGFRSALLVGYGPGEHVNPTVTTTRDKLISCGLAVPEVLRVHHGRWWSYICTDPGCCPPEGTPYDIPSSEIAARATVAGQVAFADRHELARNVAPLNGAVRKAMREATDRAERQFFVAATKAPDVAAVRGYMVTEGIPLIEDLLCRFHSDGVPATDEEIARLGVLLTNLRVRDEAWVRIDPDHVQADIAFWIDVLRRVEIPYAAAPACLLAYTAYSAGDGGLANVALDRAAEADPDYSMAGLLRDVIALGVPPTRVRLRMTPEQLAAAYDEQEQPMRGCAADQSAEAGGDEQS